MYKNISMPVCVCVRLHMFADVQVHLYTSVWLSALSEARATSTDRAEETQRPILSRRSDFHSDIIAPLIPSSVRLCSRLVGSPTGAE